MLTDEQRADGWIEHDGGVCPVAGGSMVEVMCRGLDTAIDVAAAWWWGRNPTKELSFEIIAYKLENRYGC